MTKPAQDKDRILSEGYRKIFGNTGRSTMTSEVTQAASDVVGDGNWTKLAAKLFTLDQAAYPAPWCWEQCGDKCDAPVIGAAWWEDDEDCTPIAGKLEPPPDNIAREAYRECIAYELMDHADGSASANAELIVWLRNHVREILTALRTDRIAAEQAAAERERELVRLLKAAKLSEGPLGEAIISDKRDDGSVAFGLGVEATIDAILAKYGEQDEQ